PQDYGADGMAPAEQLAAIDRRARELVAEQYRILNDEVLPGLAAGGVERVRLDDLTEAERRHVDRLFRASIAPVLTPLAIDPGHPFPHVHNKSLNIALVIERRNGGPKTRRHFAVVQVPAVLDRIVIVSTHGEGRVRFVLLEDIIARHLGELFGGLRVVNHTVFCVAGNPDLTIAREAPPFAQGRDVFDVIRSHDVLVHLPYESFGCVVDFIERAADDPQVLAIKQTLYRTSGASPIISALARAAQNGKQVTALVELKARMDEQNNITWARTLEQAGVHVVYGIVGLKPHCK